MTEEKKQSEQGKHGGATVYLNEVVSNPFIEVGDYTIFHDFMHDPRDFEKNCVLYHYPKANHDHLRIGRFCSVAAGVKFMFNAGNHTMRSLSSYPFPVMNEDWRIPDFPTTQAWDNHGDIVVGNDVWLGFESMIMAGVTIGDGAIVASRSLVTRDVPPYTIVAGMPAKPLRKRFDDGTIAALLQLEWWNWSKEELRDALVFIQSGNLDALLQYAEKRGIE